MQSMIFSSSPFFFFFAIYLLVHLAIPTRYRLTLIIAGSTFFYSYWNPWYVWLPYLLLLIAFFLKPNKFFDMGGGHVKT